MEVALIRHRRKEKRFGPGPTNGYTSGYGSKRGGRGGFLGRLGRKRNAGVAENPNALPVHATPNDVRDSYTTEQTRVEPGYENGNGGNGYNKHEQSGFAPAAATMPATGTTGHPYHTAPHSATPAQPAAAVNPYRADYGNGLGGTGNGTTVNDAATTPAQFPAGNYKYEDGVYNSNSRA